MKLSEVFGYLKKSLIEYLQKDVEGRKLVFTIYQQLKTFAENKSMEKLDSAVEYTKQLLAQVLNYARNVYLIEELSVSPTETVWDVLVDFYVYALFPLSSGVSRIAKKLSYLPKSILKLDVDSFSKIFALSIVQLLINFYNLYKRELVKKEVLVLEEDLESVGSTEEEEKPEETEEIGEEEEEDKKFFEAWRLDREKFIEALPMLSDMERIYVKTYLRIPWYWWDLGEINKMQKKYKKDPDSYIELITNVSNLDKRRCVKESTVARYYGVVKSTITPAVKKFLKFYGKPLELPLVLDKSLLKMELRGNKPKLHPRYTVVLKMLAGCPKEDFSLEEISSLRHYGDVEEILNKYEAIRKEEKYRSPRGTGTIKVRVIASILNLTGPAISKIIAKCRQYNAEE